MASDREITLGDLWRAIWRGKWIVLATTVIAGLVAFGITYTADTTYSATSKVYLGQATTILGNLASTPGTNRTPSRISSLGSVSPSPVPFSPNFE